MSSYNASIHIELWSDVWIKIIPSHKIFLDLEKLACAEFLRNRNLYATQTITCWFQKVRLHFQTWQTFCKVRIIDIDLDQNFSQFKSQDKNFRVKASLWFWYIDLQNSYTSGQLRNRRLFLGQDKLKDLRVTLFASC